MPEGAVKESPRIARLVRTVLDAAGGSGMPAVTLSWAQSLDGSIAAADGARTALSGPQSLALTHRLRSLHAGILVGIGTVLADDPLLTVRLVEGPSPRPIVLDSRLRFPLSARLLARTDLHPWIFHDRGAPAENARELASRGARLFPLDLSAGGLPLEKTLGVLCSEGISTLMVEGGARVLRSFLSSRLACQAVVTISPVTLDGIRVYRDPAEAGRLPDLLDQEQERCGQDTVIWGRLAGAGGREGP